jgi:hypothetical protein
VSHDTNTNTQKKKEKKEKKKRKKEKGKKENKHIHIEFFRDGFGIISRGTSMLALKQSRLPQHKRPSLATMHETVQCTYLEGADGVSLRLTSSLVGIAISEMKRFLTVSQ